MLGFLMVLVAIAIIGVILWIVIPSNNGVSQLTYCQICHREIPQTKLSREGYCYVCADAVRQERKEWAKAQQIRCSTSLYCPHCGSDKLQGETTGYNYGAGCLGLLILGPLGLFAGGAGAGEAKLRCLNCGSLLNYPKR